MTDYTLLKICLSGMKHLDDRKKAFVRQAAAIQASRRSTSYFLSEAQHQYLQACYDLVVSRKYGIEPMATDREFAARRAIRKSRDSR